MKESIYDQVFGEQKTFSKVVSVETGILAALLCPSFKLLPSYFASIKSEYFENHILGQITQITLDYFFKVKSYPTFDILEHEIRNKKKEVKVELLDEYLDILDTLESMLSEKDTLKYYQETFQKFIRDLFLRDKALELLGAIQSGNGKVDSVLSSLTHPPSLDQNLGLDFFALKELPQHITQTVPTLFPSLDKCFRGGGLGKKQLGVIGASSGVGKSFFMVQLGTAAAMDGKTVVHYTLELEDTTIAERYARRMSEEADIWGGFDRSEFDYDVINRIKYYSRYHGKLIIKEMNRCKAIDLEAHLNMLGMVKGYKPDLILIDSPDDMLPNESYKGMEKYDRFLEIYMDIIELAKKFMCPVWVITQMNRKSFLKTQTGLDDTGGSWGKVMKATIYLGISQTKKEKGDGEFRVTILKNSHGREWATVKFKLDMETAYIKDVGYVDENKIDKVIEETLDEEGGTYGN